MVETACSSRSRGVPDDDRRDVSTPDGANRILGPDDDLTLPEVLPGFSAPLRRVFG